MPATPAKQFNSINRFEPFWFAQLAVAGEPESILSGLPSPIKVKSRTKYDGEPQLALSEPTARFFAPLFSKKSGGEKIVLLDSRFHGNDIEYFYTSFFYKYLIRHYRIPWATPLNGHPS